ncbi:MAG TPA: hypothetical protein PLH23_15310 [Hyphomonadaceae bacterium]|nr:hypothetical protein [Hyphomonadaceae bacterium]HPI49641.1 hypothetical protein [Hyphomonadaceae bacterium]
MKRLVSLVASLLMTLGVAGACSAAAAGKPQIAGACSTKMGSEKGCACLADALEQSLTPEEFGRVAQAMEDNKRFSDMLPSNLSNDPKIAGVFATASLSCFT